MSYIVDFTSEVHVKWVNENEISAEMFTFDLLFSRIHLYYGYAMCARLNQAIKQSNLH